MGKGNAEIECVEMRLRFAACVLCASLLQQERREEEEEVMRGEE